MKIMIQIYYKIPVCFYLNFATTYMCGLIYDVVALTFTKKFLCCR